MGVAGAGVGLGVVLSAEVELSEVAAEVPELVEPAGELRVLLGVGALGLAGVSAAGAGVVACGVGVVGLASAGGALAGVGLVSSEEGVVKGSSSGGWGVLGESVGVGADLAVVVFRGVRLRGVADFLVGVFLAGATSGGVSDAGVRSASAGVFGSLIRHAPRDKSRSSHCRPDGFTPGQLAPQRSRSVHASSVRLRRSGRCQGTTGDGTCPPPHSTRPARLGEAPGQCCRATADRVGCHGVAQLRSTTGVQEPVRRRPHRSVRELR
ncbi:hypothetical protein EV138_1184 [Kribbella voronezhensis]|uniref:Uncharacterized protein n=1 Tax=Kribbella voronezhensis TaxID=2512212 RepID=A0A4R7T7Q2_9ACTN|nr:hypothetical protein EV138_1184 [Kribbella voronezhensis]